MENTNKELEYALEHSMDQGTYPDVFDENIGMDFHLDEHPDWYPKKRIYCGVRKCEIEITSYRGMCWNAVHYYATIKANGIDICSDTVDSDGKVYTSCHGGYLGKEFENLPREKKGEYSGFYTIEVSRPVMQSEIDHDPEMWKGYDAGDKTHRFDTPKEAEKTALKVAKTRFPKGWEFVVKHNY